jgi:predicted nucleic acid-binding protein
MKSDLSGSTVFDTGVLIELALDSPLSRGVRESVQVGSVQPITGEMNVAELRYVLCKKTGAEQAALSVGYLRRASQVRILPSSSFLDAASEIKCARRLSMVDCVTISIGESLGVPVLFAKRERELSLEMQRSPFKTRLLFLED